MFAFVVRRLRWLARVPLLPQLFDAVLLGVTTITAPRRLRAIEMLQREMRETTGVTTTVHRFGGVGFKLNGMEIGHVHGNGLVDVLLGRVERERIVGAGRALPHHIFPRSGWVSFWMCDIGDVPNALELLRLAILRHEIPNSTADASQVAQPSE
jgi:hypothetical protein